MRINLQNNRVEKAENLKHLPQLVHFDISKNAVKSMVDLEELKECPMIQSLDIHGNGIEDEENYIPFMEQMKSVIAIQSKDNPFCQKIKQVRRRLINACPNLHYFDDRPVEAVDRAAAVAWAEAGEGPEGLAAERTVRREMTIAKQSKFIECSLEMHKKGQEAKENRKTAMKKMM